MTSNRQKTRNPLGQNRFTMVNRMDGRPNTDPSYWHDSNPVLLLTVAKHVDLSEKDAAVLLSSIAEDVGGESHDSVVIESYIHDYVTTG